MPRERVQNSLGSGVIVDPNGLIVTNHHVIKDAQDVTVVLSDRREFDAKILLTDERADLAVLKIDVPSEHLPVLELGDSDQLAGRRLVLAIGNPFGVGQTVTSGIVSGLARTGIGVSDFGSFIQTDAAINPGNSGGALVDLDGKLVGINTAIFSRIGRLDRHRLRHSGGAGAAVLDAAENGSTSCVPGSASCGQDVTADIAPSSACRSPAGVLVKDVVPGGPAAKAGVESGDVILAVEGHEIDDPDELRFRLATLRADTPVQLTLWRDGKSRDATAMLAVPPDMPAREVTELDGPQPLAGATVANLNPAFDEELGFDPTSAASS